MNIAFYTGYTALQAYQSSLNVIGNNLANVNTVGYKQDRSNFDDLLYNKINVHENEGKLVGKGVKLESVDLVFTSGSLNMTGLPFDFAITDDTGFFALQDNEGIKYSRAGNFSLSVEDDGTYLVNGNGDYVLDKDFNKIIVEKDRNGQFISEDVYTNLGIFHFDNPYELIKKNGTAFLETEKSGAPQAAENNKTVLLQGALENSTVSISDSMVDMITAQRAFQVNSTLIRTSDEMEEIVNNLRQ